MTKNKHFVVGMLTKRKSVNIRGSNVNKKGDELKHLIIIMGMRKVVEELLLKIRAKRVRTYWHLIVIIVISFTSVVETSRLLINRLNLDMEIT